MLIFINGKAVYQKDVSTNKSIKPVAKTISLQDTLKRGSYTYGDILQIGVQCWAAGGDNDKILGTAKCSKPILIEWLQKPIDKAFIKVNKGYNRLVLHD